MKLSPRLKAVASLVGNGYSVADIGTDHAYIPIYLVKNKISPYALAMDINDGPLKIAKTNVIEAGYEGIIEVRKSDGIINLALDEVDSIVVAGMGGNLIENILLGNLQVVNGLKECILQPQSEVRRLRSFLINNGFAFLNEDVVEDDGKFYFIMKVAPKGISSKCNKLVSYKVKDTSGIDKTTGSKIWSLAELAFGKHLLVSKNEILRKYLLKEKNIKTSIIIALDNEVEKLKKDTLLEISKSNVETTRRIRNICIRKEELLAELDLIKGGLLYYDM